jgi:AAA family ATP:ADP antiporter
MHTGHLPKDAARIVVSASHERTGVALSFGYFFFLLSSYYVLRPLRDEMGIQGGVQHLPWLFTGTLVAMLCAVPVFGWVSARWPRRRMLPAVYGFFILNLLAFFLAFRGGFQVQWTARAFFIWVSVFNLFAVSVFWSVMVELFGEADGKRLFGLIAAGGSGGALVGPTLTALLAPVLGTSGLLLLAAVFLVLATVCMFRLLAWARQGREDHAVEARRDEAIGGSIWSGVTGSVRSRYMIGIAVHMVLYTTLSTFLYLQQARIMAATIEVSEARAALFAMMDFAVNGLSLAIQLFLTETLLRRLGTAFSLAILPVLTILGFALIAVFPILGVVVGFQVIRRCCDYAIARPARELLFTVVSLDEKYKAKNFVDTVVFRCGDAFGGWVFAAVRSAGLGFAAISWLAVPLAVAWLAISVVLGRRGEALGRVGGGLPAASDTRRPHQRGRAQGA